MTEIFPEIVVIKRNGADGPQFPLRTNECLFGRKPECDIRIQLPNVSLEHAVVRVDNDRKIKIINLSSCNQTLVNGKPVNEAEIQHLDVLTISDRSFRFELQVQKQVKSPKNQHHRSIDLANTPQEKKTPKMITPRGSPRTPPTGGSLKENICILRRHSMPLQEEEEALAPRTTDKKPFSSIDVNTETEEGTDNMQPVKRKPGEEQKTRRHSKRVSFGPALSPEHFDKDLPPATPVRRGAMPKRLSIASDHSLMAVCSSSKKRRSVAASPQEEVIKEEYSGEDLSESEMSKTQRQSSSELFEVDDSSLEEREEFHEDKQLYHKCTTPMESNPSEISQSTEEADTPSARRRSSLRLGRKSPRSPELYSVIDEVSETVLDSDDYTSDEEDEVGRAYSGNNKSIHTELEKMRNKMLTPLRNEITNGIQLRQTKKKIATPLRKEIANGIQLRQTKKKIATPLRKEIANGIQLRQTKKKLATPLRKEIANGIQLRLTKKKIATPLRKEIAIGIQLRQTKKKLATPLRKEIANGIQLRQTKKKIATPLRKEIANGIQLRQTKKKLATPLRKEIANGIQLRQTKKKIATPLRKEIANGIQLRQTKKKLATPLRKEIANGIQLRPTKKKIATPLRKEIANGIQLRQTKKKIATPLRKEIANGIQLRQTKKKLATPLRKEIANGIQLRQTKKKLATPLRKEIAIGIQLRQTRKKIATPLRKEIANGIQLRQTKKKMVSPLRKEIANGMQLRQTKKKMTSPLRKEIANGIQLRQTKKKIATPLRKEIANGITLKAVKKSQKRVRSEDGTPTNEPKKIKLSPSDARDTSVRRALKTPLRKAIVAGTKLRQTRHRMATPIRKQIHSKPTLRAVRRKSTATTVSKTTVPRKPTYAEIVKRSKKTSVKEFTKTEASSSTRISGAVLTKQGAANTKAQLTESHNNTSLVEKKPTPRRKSSSWMSSLARTANGVKTRATSVEDLQGVSELFLTPSTAQMSEESSSKNQKGNWLSSLSKATNGPRRRGTPVEDLVGVSEMFLTPPSMNVVAAKPDEQLVGALSSAKTPSLRRSGKDTSVVEMVEPLELSKTPSLRHAAEEVVSLQIVTPVQVSRTPSLRSAKKQLSVLTNEHPDIQLEFVPPIEPRKTPSVRSLDDVKAVVRKSVGNARIGRKSVGLEGLKRLMKSPKQNNAVENCEDSFVPGLFASPKPPPKRYSRKSEGLQGVARLLSTPNDKDKASAESPKLDGIKEMMQTRDLTSPNFVGLRVLMKTPKTGTESVDPEDHFSSELFALSVEDSPPEKQHSPNKSDRKNRQDSKLSVQVINLTSQDTQASESTSRTRAKRNAPKSSAEPVPKRARRTRATVSQEDESKPETSSHPKAAQNKRTLRSKRNPTANTQTTPKLFAFKRTQLEPIIEVPSPLPSFGNHTESSTSSPSIHMKEEKASEEKRSTRNTTQVNKETKTPFRSSRHGKRAQSEAESSWEEIASYSSNKSEPKIKGRTDGAEKGAIETEEPKMVKTRSTRSSREVPSQDNKIRATRSQSTESSQPEKQVVSEPTINNATRRSRRATRPVEENISLLEETKSTRSTRRKDIEKSENSKATGKARGNHVEKTILEEDREEVQQENSVLEEAKPTRSTRSKNTIQKSEDSKTTRKTRAGNVTEKISIEDKVQQENSVLENTKPTRRTRSKNTIEKNEDSKMTRKTRASSVAEKIIVEEDQVQQNSSILEETKPTRHTRIKNPPERSEDSKTTRKTRGNRAVKIIIEEDTKVEEDISVVEETKSTRSARSKNIPEKSEDSKLTRSTRRNEKMIPEEDAQIQEENSVARTRAKRELEVKSSVESTEARSTRSEKPTKHEREENTVRTTRSTKRSHQDASSTAPEPKRTRLSARIQTRSSSRN